MPQVDLQIGTRKAVLFDFDGCFADTEHLHLRAYTAAFAKFHHKIDPEEYFERFTHYGNGVAKEIEYYALKIAPDKITELKTAEYEKIIREESVKVFPEIPHIVEALHKRGIKVAIASNSPKLEIRTILKKHGTLLDKVDLIVGKLPNLRKKPAPDIFLHTLAELKLKPKEALVIEDSDRGLEAAQAAGVDAVWIRTSINDKFTSNHKFLASINHRELLGLV